METLVLFTCVCVCSSVAHPILRWLFGTNSWKYPPTSDDVMFVGKFLQIDIAINTIGYISRDSGGI